MLQNKNAIKKSEKRERGHEAVNGLEFTDLHKGRKLPKDKRGERERQIMTTKQQHQCDDVDEMCVVWWM